MDAAPFRSWDGWCDLFNCIGSLEDQSQFDRDAAESIDNTFSQFSVSSASDPDVYWTVMGSASPKNDP